MRVETSSVVTVKFKSRVGSVKINSLFSAYFRRCPQIDKDSPGYVKETTAIFRNSHSFILSIVLL